MSETQSPRRFSAEEEIAFLRDRMDELQRQTGPPRLTEAQRRELDEQLHREEAARGRALMFGRVRVVDPLARLKQTFVINPAPLYENKIIEGPTLPAGRGYGWAED